MKRSTVAADERIETMEWRLTMRIARRTRGKENSRMELWLPHQTQDMQINGKIRKRWESVVNDFLKLEETEVTEATNWKTMTHGWKPRKVDKDGKKWKANAQSQLRKSTSIFCKASHQGPDWFWLARHAGVVRRAYFACGVRRELRRSRSFEEREVVKGWWGQTMWHMSLPHLSRNYSICFRMYWSSFLLQFSSVTQTCPWEHFFKFRRKCHSIRVCALSFTVPRASFADSSYKVSWPQHSCPNTCWCHSLSRRDDENHSFKIDSTSIRADFWNWSLVAANDISIPSVKWCMREVDSGPVASREVVQCVVFSEAKLFICGAMIVTNGSDVRYVRRARIRSHSRRNIITTLPEDHNQPHFFFNALWTGMRRKRHSELLSGKNKQHLFVSRFLVPTWVMLRRWFFSGPGRVALDHWCTDARAPPRFGTSRESDLSRGTLLTRRWKMFAQHWHDRSDLATHNLKRIEFALCPFGTDVVGPPTARKPLGILRHEPELEWGDPTRTCACWTRMPCGALRVWWPLTRALLRYVVFLVLGGDVASLDFFLGVTPTFALTGTDSRMLRYAQFCFDLAQIWTFLMEFFVIGQSLVRCLDVIYGVFFLEVTPGDGVMRQFVEGCWNVCSRFFLLFRLLSSCSPPLCF